MFAYLLNVTNLGKKKKMSQNGDFKKDYQPLQKTQKTCSWNFFLLLLLSFIDHCWTEVQVLRQVVILWCSSESTLASLTCVFAGVCERNSTTTSGWSRWQSSTLLSLSEHERKHGTLIDEWHDCRETSLDQRDLSSPFVSSQRHDGNATSFCTGGGAVPRRWSLHLNWTKKVQVYWTGWPDVTRSSRLCCCCCFCSMYDTCTTAFVRFTFFSPVLLEPLLVKK